MCNSIICEIVLKTFSFWFFLNSQVNYGFRNSMKLDRNEIMGMLVTLFNIIISIYHTYVSIPLLCIKRIHITYFSHPISEQFETSIKQINILFYKLSSPLFQLSCHQFSRHKLKESKTYTLNKQNRFQRISFIQSAVRLTEYSNIDWFVYL